MTAVFDATGTIRAVAGQANLLDKDGQIIDGGKALTTDSMSSVFSGLVGAAPAAVYIEQNILLPLLLNIGLLALALFGYTTFRHFSSRSTESLPSTAVNNELRILRAINEEIVSLLPL